jgi:hypothetical protein
LEQRKTQFQIYSHDFVYDYVVDPSCVPPHQVHLAYGFAHFSFYGKAVFTKKQTGKWRMPVCILYTTALVEMLQCCMN